MAMDLRNLPINVTIQNILKDCKYICGDFIFTAVCRVSQWQVIPYDIILSILLASGLHPAHFQHPRKVNAWRSGRASHQGTRLVWKQVWTELYTLQLYTF